MPRQIIIDTDPGQDDAFAILLALASPELSVLGITTVAGNVPLEKTTRNARVICELAGRRDIRIFAGCDRPMTRELVTAEYVHGLTGLDGATLAEPSMPVEPAHAVDFIVDSLRSAPKGRVTLCPLGPLTNIATAFRRAPDIIEKVQEIVLMGGAYFEVGNVTPAAEFNIYVDPEAAEIVLKSGVPIVIMPLDVTHKVVVTRPWIDRIDALGTPVAKAAAGWANFFSQYDSEKYNSDGAPMHDPTVIAYLLQPEIFAGRFINVEIETQSDLTRGMTVADWWGVTHRKKNATFVGSVDAPAFFDLLAERLARL